MENKKTVVAIIVVIILIIALVVISYLYNSFNTKQVNLLTAESNKILKSDLITQTIDFNIKTEKDFATVEKAIKEYVTDLKNIYIQMEQLVSGINPDSIFSAQNISGKNLDAIDVIIEEYKEKSQEGITEIETLVEEENIIGNINERKFSSRKDYYINIYNTVMLSDAMKKQYEEIEEETKNEKGRLYEKLKKIEKIKDYLEKYEDSWEIKDGQVQFINLNRITEYYNLVNQLAD